MTQRIVLCRANIITLAGSGTLPLGFVSVNGNGIESIGPMDALRLQPDDITIDVGGRSVLPGLVDAHCHLISENAFPVTEPYFARSMITGVWAARSALEDGLTSVRDVGCRHQGIYSLKAAVEAGQIPGPRFQTAGRPLSGTGIMETWRSHSHDGPVEVVRGVRREWQAGANWIKLSISDGRWRGSETWQDTPLMAPEEIHAAVEEAHRRDLRVVCHVDGPIGARLAVEGGVDSIEHGVDIPDEVLSLMAERSVYYVPTVWIYSTRDLKVFRADLSSLNARHTSTIQRALAAGVRIAAGIDFSFEKVPPLEGLVNELEALVERGMSTTDALLAVTLRGIELMGWESELGTLAPGKIADLVVVDGDPAASVGALRKVDLVMQNGRIVVNRLTGFDQPQSTLMPAIAPSWMR